MFTPGELALWDYDKIGPLDIEFTVDSILNGQTVYTNEDIKVKNPLFTGVVIMTVKVAGYGVLQKDVDWKQLDNGFELINTNTFRLGETYQVNVTRQYEMVREF